jgi:predicted nuclease of predicted toxin-antitoxin system
MKFKLDDNLGKRVADLMRLSGYEIATVPEENLSGAADRVLIDACRIEERCLITLDLEFANPLLFKPADYKGIIVLRLPPKPSPTGLLEIIATLTKALKRKNLHGKLWIVQRDRIREYQPQQ